MQLLADPDSAPKGIALPDLNIADTADVDKMFDNDPSLWTSPQNIGSLLTQNRSALARGILSDVGTAGLTKAMSMKAKISG